MLQQFEPVKGKESKGQEKEKAMGKGEGGVKEKEVGKEGRLLALIEGEPSWESLAQILSLCSESHWDSSFYATIYLRCAQWLNRLESPSSNLVNFSEGGVKALTGFIDRNLVHLAAERGIQAVYQSRLIEKCLELLGRVWQQAKEQVDCHCFYVDSANQYLDLHTDYLRWRGAATWSFLGHAHVLDVERKGEALRVDHTVRMRHELQDAFFRTLFDGVQNPHLTVQVRRPHVLTDTLQQLPALKPHDLRKQLRVIFEGEEAVDEGGVQKEYFQLLMEEMLAEETGLFCCFNGRTHWLQGDAAKDMDMNRQGTPGKDRSKEGWSGEVVPDAKIEKLSLAAGLLLGLALYNGVLIEAAFPRAFFKALLGWPLRPADWQEIDPELWQSLQACLEMDRDTFESAFPPDSLVCEGMSFDWENRQAFVQVYLEQKLAGPSLTCLREGFRRVCHSPLIDCLAPSELELLLCGSPHLDFEALQRVTVYEGGYTVHSPQVLWFWELVTQEMTMEQQRHLLAFVTGCDKSPPGGLGRLAFTLCRNGPDCDRLPTAHTCFNTLLLNEYASKDRLRHYLFVAIENYAGFGLR